MAKINRFLYWNSPLKPWSQRHPLQGFTFWVALCGLGYWMSKKMTEQYV